MSKVIAGSTLELAGNSRFEIVRRIGAGGIGLVYEAIDHMCNTRVAIKTLQHLDSDGLLRFKQEFRFLQDIHHRNLIQLGELFQDDGQWFFTMELLDGVDFLTHVVATTELRQTGASLFDISMAIGRVHKAARGQLSASQTQPGHSCDEDRLRQVLQQLAQGLCALHQAGMVHRDIKPHNVMVCDGRVVLLDFGLVSEERPWHQYRLGRDQVIGTPNYMAPEQLTGMVTPASDWYAVGVMLYQALTGVRPFKGTIDAVLQAKCRRIPMSPSQRVRRRGGKSGAIPADLEALCMDLLRRRPGDRPTGPEVLARLAGTPVRSIPARGMSAQGIPARGMPVRGMSVRGMSVQQLGWGKKGVERDAGSDALIGREAELIALRTALRQCAPGRPVIGFVHGGSGMGKTAVLECFAQEARDRLGAVVLRGRCYEREAVPYKAFDGVIDDLSQYLHSRVHPGAGGAGSRATASETGRERAPEDAEPAPVGTGDAELTALIERELPGLLPLFPVLGIVPTPGREQAGSESGGESGSESGRAVGSESGRAVGSESGRAVGSESGRAVGSESGRAMGSESGRAMGSESGRAMGSESGSDVGAARLGDDSAPGAAAGIRDPGEQRRQAFLRLKRVLAWIAGQTPLIVVIDDLQWSDLDSAALLTEIISSPDAPGLMLIASYRGEEAEGAPVTRFRDSAARTLAADDVCDVEIGPLREEDARALAVALWHRLDSAGYRVGYPQRMAPAVARESGGSPFFVGEIVRYLVTATAPWQPLESALSRANLGQVLIARRRQLSAEAQTLVDVIAVAGQPIAQAVALAAAGLDGSHLGLVTGLRAGNFVRTRGPALTDSIEMYHDRIRDAVIDQLDQAALRRYHGCLAAALEAAGSADAEMLTGHFVGAGQLDRAADYAIQAARNAERALAFARAAELYRLVLAARADTSGTGSGTGTNAEFGDLYVRLGDALANADRSIEAANAYLAAAEHFAALDQGRLAMVQPEDIEAPECTGQLIRRLVDQQTGQFAGDPEGSEGTVECRRRAAEQLLRSGNTRDGLVLLRALLAAANLSLPRSKHGALIALLQRRIKLRWRGLDYRPRDPETLPAEVRRRADLCWSAAIGLGAIDPIRGADFSTRCLLMALDQGDEARIATTLALEASHLSVYGRKTAKRASALASKALAVAHRVGDPLAIGFSTCAPGLIAFNNGSWRQARKRVTRAERFISAQCTGVSWEVTAARLHECAALYYLGDWGLMRTRTAPLMRQALARGDVYTAATLAPFAACGDLGADDVAGARRTMEVAAVRWTQRGYQVQRYMQLLGSIHVDLYERKDAQAWERIAAEMAIRRSLLFQMQLTRIEFSFLRARVALSVAASGAAGAARRARVASREARRMERERMSWGTALAVLTRAGVAACCGDRQGALALLERAIDRLESADMSLFAAAARWQQGGLLGTAQGAEIMATAAATMGARGIVNPGAVANTLAPGFAATRHSRPALQNHGG